MISSQRIIYKAFNSIINFNNKIPNTRVLYNFSSDQGKLPNYQFPFNFNRQQYKGYIKKVEKAKQQISQTQKLEAGTLLPRRKRRVYDRPKHDTDLTGYAVWRLCDPEELTMKFFEHGLPVAAKLYLQPKWVIHAFGQGLIPINNVLGSHRQYVFEDNNFSRFLLYEYRNTTLYKKNIPDYDYQNQQHLRPQMRKKKRLQPKQFWQSQEQFQFRLNVTNYAQHLKFCKWIQQNIEKKKSEESFDSIIDKKFGKAVSYNEKEDLEAFQPRSPIIMHANPQSFQQVKKQQKAASKGKKQKKVEEAVVQEKPKATFNFSYKLDQKFRKQKEQKKQEKKVQSSSF